MIKFDKVKKAYDSAQKFLGRRGPGVLTGFGIVLFGIAIWQTYSRSDDIQAAVQKKRQEGGGKVEQVLAGAKEAAPALVATAGGAVCVIAAQKMSLDMISAITATASTAMDARDILEKQLEEAVGKEKAAEIVDKTNSIVSDRVVKADKPEAITGHGNDLFVDPLFGIKFRASAAFIRNKMADAEIVLKKYDEFCVFDLFRSFDIPSSYIPEICKSMFWSTLETETIDYRLVGSSYLDEDTGEPYGELIFIDKPSGKY